MVAPLHWMFPLTTARPALVSGAAFVLAVTAALFHGGLHPVTAADAAELRSLDRESDTAPFSGPVDYATVDRQPVAGYAAYPGREGPYPAVVVIHDRWGLTDQVRAQARRLADEGYLALAIDLYEGTVPADRGQAAALLEATRADPERIATHLRHGVFHLRVQPEVSTRAALGWGPGGDWAIEAALMFPGELDAVVVHYGGLAALEDASAEGLPPLLGHFGEADDRVPVDEVRRIERRLVESGAAPEFHFHAAGHGFANATDRGYDRDAAVRAWQGTAGFLDRHLEP